MRIRQPACPARQLGRFLERELLEGLPRGPTKPIDRDRPEIGVDRCRLGGVERQFRQVTRILPEEVGDGECDPAVHPRLARGAQLAAEGGPYECVGESESVGAHVVEEPGGHRQFEVVEEIQLVPPGRGSYDPEFELEAEHRDDPQRFLHLFVEARHPSTYRTLHVDRTVSLVHRLEEQRVPRCLSHDLVDVEIPADQLHGFGTGQSVETQHRVLLTTETCRNQVGDTRVEIRGGIPAGEHEGHRGVVLAPLQVRQELQCRVRGPVDVIDDHRDRRCRAELAEPVRNGLEHPVAPRLAVDRRLAASITLRAPGCVAGGRQQRTETARSARRALGVARCLA